MEERELLGGLNGEGGDGEGEGGRRREAGEVFSLLPRLNGEKLSHLQTVLFQTGSEKNSSPAERLNLTLIDFNSRKYEFKDRSVVQSDGQPEILQFVFCS